MLDNGGFENYKFNKNHQSWNFSGISFSQEKIEIACVYKDETLIVTVFYGD